ncbi:hypothetical protein [Colwellia sp. RSH04]|nr:hypothetical protein [Colwellia sp. RSH04]
MRELNVNEIEQVVGGGMGWLWGGLAYDAVKWGASQDWGTASYEDMMLAP